MPWTWTDTLDASVDLTDVAFLAVFAAAFQERAAAANQSTQWAAPLAGCDALVANATYPLDGNNTLSVLAMQRQIQYWTGGTPGGGSTGYSYARNDGISAWDGETQTPKAWRFPDLIAAVNGQDEFQRRFEKIYRDNDPSHIYDGQVGSSAYAAAVVGDKAMKWCMGADLTGDGRIYEYKGGGVWELKTDLTIQADVVTAYGPFRSGDLFGWWLFDEIRACLKKLVRTLSLMLDNFNAGDSNVGSDGSTWTTPEFAEAEAVTRFESGGYVGTADFATKYSSLSVYENAIGQTGYIGNLLVAACTATLSRPWNTTILAERTAQSEVYVWAFAGPRSDIDTGFQTTYEFDDFGTGLHDSAFTLVGTDTGSDASFDTPLIGDTTEPDAWPATPGPPDPYPAGAYIGWRGFRMGQIAEYDSAPAYAAPYDTIWYGEWPFTVYAVADHKWDVSGGFVYRG